MERHDAQSGHPRLRLGSGLSPGDDPGRARGRRKLWLGPGSAPPDQPIGPLHAAVGAIAETPGKAISSMRRRIPVVGLLGQRGTPTRPVVHLDDEAIGRLAARQLLERGYRRGAWHLLAQGKLCIRRPRQRLRLGQLILRRLRQDLRMAAARWTTYVGTPPVRLPKFAVLASWTAAGDSTRRPPTHHGALAAATAHTHGTPMIPALAALLAQQHASLRLIAVRHQDTVPQQEASAALVDGAELTLGEAKLRVGVTTAATSTGGTRLDCTFTVQSGQVEQAAVGLALDFARWSVDEWVFMPACVYAGNRFPQQPKDWWKQPLASQTEPDPATWVTITSCPHLTHGAGPSRIQVLVGDCSTPCVGVQGPTTGRGLLLITDQGSMRGDQGLDVIESDDRRTARVVVKSPGVREGGKYNYKGVLPDRGITLATGDRITVRAVLHAFAAATPEDLYARFMAARKDLSGPIRERHDLPFASAFKLIEDKHNKESWTEPHGYWSVGMRESSSQDWQTGWVGGSNTIWPLLIAGDATSFHRALRAWDFVANSATPSGFLRGGFGDGKWNDDRMCYLRYSGDTLYFLMKTLLHLRVGPPHTEARPAWLQLAQGLCEGLVKVWNEAGHIPHHVDGRTGKVIVGGSCAGSLTPAGLALAARYFDEPRYRTVAEGAARRYRDNFLAKGLTNGGPGDIYQNVDSESAAALLESFVVLMEESGGAPEWIDAARRCAAYCATWVTSYDFRFPARSTFGKLDMLTTGTVWANVQNKHAAPGICTLSGASLLKLWRATGEACWLDLIRDIARTLPQYVSRADRPIPDTRDGKRWKVMPPGWVNERVNLSDWEVRGEPWEEIGVGEIFGGSCWAEPAVLNTIAEVPGIHLMTDTLELTVIDHVHVQLHHVSPDRIVLRLTNSTRFPAAPILLAEDTNERATRWLSVNPLSGLPAITVPPFATVEHTVWRETPTRMNRA